MSICVVCKQQLSPADENAYQQALKMEEANGEDLPVVCPLCTISRDDSHLDFDHIHIMCNNENGVGAPVEDQNDRVVAACCVRHPDRVVYAEDDEAKSWLTMEIPPGSGRIVHYCPECRRAYEEGKLV